MWEIFKPEDTVWYCWRLNGADAYLRKNGGSWQTAFNTIPFCERTSELSGPKIQEPPETLPLTRAWGIGEEIFLHPYLSSQPYLLKAKEKIRLAYGQQISFTAILPPNLKFEITQDIVLNEAMPLAPQKTLIGQDPMTGILAHCLSDCFTPKEEGEKNENPSIFIQCEVIIKNNDKNMFEIQEFAIFPEQLNVYVCNDKLFADTVEYENCGESLGSEQKTTISQIKNSDYRLISAAAKNGANDTLVRQSVDILKNIARGMS